MSRMSIFVRSIILSSLSIKEVCNKLAHLPLVFNVLVDASSEGHGGESVVPTGDEH